MLNLARFSAKVTKSPPKIRQFHSCLPKHGSEEYEYVQEMMDLRMAPPDNSTETKKYAIPRSLLASWAQQRRFTGGSAEGRFKDVTIVKLRSGDGGNGKICFQRESGRSVGPPDGGDGGSGGHVFVQASPNISSLAHIRHVYNAQNGTTGGSTQLTGKRGENVILQVPVGTQLRWSPPIQELRALNQLTTEYPEEDNKAFIVDVQVVTNWSRFENDTAIQLEREVFPDGVGGWIFKEQEKEKWLVNPHFKKVVQRVKQFDLINRRQERSSDMFRFNGIDLSEPGEPQLLLTGGSGGLGNMHFQSPELRSPTFAKQGRFGCEITLILEMKLLADLGLVGLPNAGKSTLLRSISRAKPQVGDYEFTTLVPSLGTISLGIEKKSFTVADIPGIIKDAHLDKGLGLGFLRHVERCKGLAFVIALDRPDPVADLNLLMAELGSRLSGKNVLVIATKADLPETETNYFSLKAFIESKNWDIVPCSAKEGNVEGVIRMMAKTANLA